MSLIGIPFNNYSHCQMSAPPKLVFNTLLKMRHQKQVSASILWNSCSENFEKVLRKKSVAKPFLSFVLVTLQATGLQFY